ncbi:MULTISPECIES: DUF2530 domain-containing protein [unclassified Ornithinimicrobium]|uniref:DUF2530 domain-containing protein n=1 Tax=unclassified Ornithinimicrobium TaxID=2615080 RepID=UPI0038540A56
MQTPSPPPSEQPTDIPVPEVTVRTIVLVRWGLLVWAVALVVLLLVPELRSGEREWWVWVPVAGLAGGALGHVYLARGRGNAAMA